MLYGAGANAVNPQKDTGSLPRLHPPWLSVCSWEPQGVSGLCFHKTDRLLPGFSWGIPGRAYALPKPQFPHHCSGENGNICHTSWCSVNGQGLRVLGCASIRVITMTVFPQLKGSPLSSQHFSFAISRHSAHNVM